jgi:hypothetical protein
MRTVRCMIVALLVSVAGSAEARNDRLLLPIGDALRAGAGRLDPGIRLSFGGGGAGGRRYTANRKTNSMGRGDKEACEWAFLSAALALQERARKEGGHAVAGITSVDRRREVTSATQYVCNAGNVVVGVALRGSVVGR